MIQAPMTIPAALEAAVQQWPDALAVQDGDTQLSFNDLLLQSRLAARAMMANGLQAGQRFAIWAPNIHEWIWTAMGGMMAGGILVPLNTRYRGIEAGDILRRSQARMLFTTTGFLDTDYPGLLKDEALPELEHTVLLRGSEDDRGLPGIKSILASADDVEEAALDARLARLDGDSISDIMYTSGTTGAPKGVLSSHAQTVAIFDAWSGTVGLTSGDRYLIVNPFFHSFGYKAGWLSCLLRGATALPMAVFNPAQTLRLIEHEQITVLPGAPTIFQTLLAEQSLSATDLSSLRCAVTGAASVPEQLVHDMKQVLQFDEVFTAYGLTECPVVSITRPGDDIAIIANTAGRALPDTEVRIVDDQGSKLAADEVGRIQVRGYNVMQGYFENPQATAETIVDGWLETGDLGWMDANGYIKVTDRAKDMFISGGFNCYPAEIENLLLRHPGIDDVAVVGTADERLGEIGHAYIVSPAEALASEDLIAWAREHMANFKVPRRFFRVPELPRNASGKVQKFKLEALADRTAIE
ncbi:MAG: AMP-binding protein [Gammaproteobacteria bacterium]|nr:AMP-binding protein [Gammaproteobacteria bacterium]